ncbi:MAG: alpha/beta hydrolase [Acidimicrobiales bacterium]|nr:alpha/beta hydrolase [Acidimicrobiales bacterium]
MLPDRRLLGWLDLGDAAGRPVIHLHGTPGCAAEATPLAAAAADRGIRLVAVDRPGIGGSDPHPRRTLLDLVDDLVVLADRLELERPSVLGYSGGGPYALACGAVRPDRFATIGVVAGAGPADAPGAGAPTDRTDRVLTWLSSRAPRLGAAVVAGSGRFTRAMPGTALRIWAADLPPADRRVVQAAGVRARDVMRYLAQAMVEGARGVVDDERVLAQPWGFGAADVRAPVRWWHGADDEIVPLAEAAAVAASIPDVRFHVLPDAGHLLWPRHAGAILGSL